MSDIRLNGKMVSFSRLTLQTADPTRLQQHFQAVFGSIEDSQGMPIILDSTLAQDLPWLLAQFDLYGVQVLAVLEGALAAQARMRKIPVLPNDQPMQRVYASEPVVPVVEAVPVHATAAQASAESTAAAQTAAAPTTATAAAPNIVVQKIAGQNSILIHRETLRTGQQLVADYGDVTLLSAMNSGSELIAMGHVHAYDVVRGRLIAGASGYTQARIFCQQLEAELVSIAGTYCVAEDIPAEFWGKAVQISLDPEGTLVFRHLHAED